MTKIVIGVACHKPSELPNNELYLPIHVGAANASKPLPGLQRDDEGDNISHKNPTYCELTAQYWLWKNVNADYYGLCHYRRYMSFADTRFDHFTDDRRKQVSINSLNSYTRNMYALDDSEAMRKLIESYDVVATENQVIRHVLSADGYKRTAYGHFAGQAHNLINKEDMDEMFSIVKERFPQYYGDLVKYMNGPLFRGFNCFVMRRDLFFEMCEYEFAVLEELERRIDLTNHDATRTRIFGFMAEILYSGFLFHLQQRGERIHDVQMLYFQSTDPIEPLEPISGALPVCFVQSTRDLYRVGMALESFARNSDPSKNYDVMLFYSEYMLPFYMNLYSRIAQRFPNITLRFKDWSVLDGAIEDILGSSYGAPHLYLPYILPNHSRVLVLNEFTFIRKDISELFDIDLEGKPIAAAHDILRIGRFNGVKNEERKWLTDKLKLDNGFDFFNSAVVLMDLNTMRQSGYDAAELPQKLRALEMRTYSNYPDEVLNIVFEGNVHYLSQSWCREVANDWNIINDLNHAPLRLFKDYNACKDTNAITNYQREDPYWPFGDDFEVEFWNAAKDSDLFPYFQNEFIRIQAIARGRSRASAGNMREKFEKRIPKGSPIRSIILQACPSGTRRFKLLSNIYKRFVS